MNDYNNKFEAYLDSGKVDSKGRPIGYIVGFNNNGEDFCAWAQNARKVKGEWVDFGVIQRSKSFSSQKAASEWAYPTAKARIAGLK
jgi:hypothetical protein